MPDAGSVVRHTEEDVHLVYICLCNALTDADVQRAMDCGARRLVEVFRSCGCASQCGSCARTLQKLLRESAHASVPS